MAPPAARPLFLRYEVPEAPAAWELGEDLVPESQPHDMLLDHLKSTLRAWVARTGRDARVARNLAVRWIEARPQIGVDPDLAVVEPDPPEGDELMSLCTWRPGSVPPRLAIEIVSSTGARKDYVSAPLKYAASGTAELIVFDPKLAGPVAHGGPFRLQRWVRTSDDEFERVYAGPGPVLSEYLGAWLIATDEGRRLRVFDDPRGDGMWPTDTEAERAAKEAERAAKEAERAAKEAERAAKEVALARVAELEAALAARGASK